MMGMAATMSTLLQAMGLAAHWLRKPSEKPRIMPTAVTEPLRKVASIRPLAPSRSLSSLISQNSLLLAAGGPKSSRGRDPSVQFARTMLAEPRPPVPRQRHSGHGAALATA